MEIKKGVRIGKKAQITVFLILAILIVAVLFLLFGEKAAKFTTIFTGDSPISQIENCIQKNAKEAIDILSVQGGAINPENYYLYESNKVDYVCYTQEYYKLCIMQKPLLKESIEKEVKNYLDPKVSDCINSIKTSFERKGYDFFYTKPEIMTEIVPGSFLIKVKSNIEITKSATENYQEMQINVESNLYDFVMTATSISNWEARYGDSETMMYMIYYPNLKVEKKIRIDGTRIYILTNREKQDKFIFATRSFPVPPGITGN